jgi:8-oxo-dGTP pyrophosphatase MutT (NUDIX family)
VTEPTFVPRPGQTDYTHIRYAPVINACIFNDGQLLLVQRSTGMRNYPGLWHCIGGFLDDDKSIEDKVIEEIEEEAGIDRSRIISMERAAPVIREDDTYGKTWITIPVRVEVEGREFTLNWEAEDARWIDPATATDFELMPDFEAVLAEMMPGGA